MIQYKGYTGVVEYDPTIELFAGHVVDIKDTIYFEGKSVDEVRSNMAELVDEHLRVCEERGEEPAKPFSGQIRVRMATNLHRKAAITAESRGVSLNTLINKAIEHEVGA